MVGLIFRKALICIEGNLRFKIDWASLLLEGNVPFLLCFTLYLSCNLQVPAPPQGAYIRRGDVTEVFFFCVEFRGLIFGGAYTRRSLFSEFYGITKTQSNKEEDRQ